MSSLVAGCGGSGDDTAHGAGGSSGSGGSTTIPPSVVNEQKTHASPAPDDAFTTFEVTQYRTTDVLADLDVRALVFVGSDLYAGTANGLAKLKSDGSGFDPVTLDGTGPVIDLCVLGASTLVALRSDRVVLPTQTYTLTGITPTSVAAHGSDVIVGSDQGAAIVNASGMTSVVSGVAVRDLAVRGDVLYIATAAGVRRWDLAGSKALADWHAPAVLPDDDVRALAATSDGKAVLAGTSLGYAKIDASGTSEQHVAGVGALAEGDVLALAESAGDMLVGHAIGVTSGQHHYHSLRYMPDEKTTAVAIASDGTRYIATHAGIARHAPKSTTLAEKAALLEGTTDIYVRMDGFMDDEVFWNDPWDHAPPPGRSDSDNDGLWTEMQIGAWCFAYAATGDQKYYDKAKQSLDVMLLEIDVPGATFQAQGKPRGFITRSLVRSDEGAVYDGKKTESNWHAQDFGGKSYYWKDDTSSDEYTGHFFGLPLYYDLCATEAEKPKLREYVDAVMGYVVDNDYKLIDLDGKPTTFGDWSGMANAVDGIGACLSAHLDNCAAAFGGEGWLNGTEILGYLLAAWHVTGNDRYYKEYLKLAVDQRYAEMVTPKDTTLTVVSPKNANHSDHELAILAYFTLLRYEPDAKRRATYQDALRAFYAYEKDERNALELGLMASALPDVDAAAGARTLREIAADRRKWLFDNGYRKDATLSPSPDRFDDPQFTSVFAYDELGELEWNGNLYGVKQGGDGRGVQSVWPYLLPYWSLRYYGAIK